MEVMRTNKKTYFTYVFLTISKLNSNSTCDKCMPIAKD